jgi:hypothetical protein
VSRKTETLAINFPSISDADFKVVSRRGGAVVARFPFKKGSLASQATALKNAELLIHSRQVLKERAELLIALRRLNIESCHCPVEFIQEARRILRDCDKD